MRVLLSKVKRNLSNHLLSSQVVSINERHFGIKIYREGTTSSIKLLVIEPTHEEVKITERPIRSTIDTSALSGLRLAPLNNFILMSVTYQRGHQLSRTLQFYILDPDELSATQLNLSGIPVPVRNGYNLCQINETQFLVCGGVTVAAAGTQQSIVSGAPNSTVLADAYIIDLQANSSMKAANLPYPLRRFSLTYVQNRVILIGGSQYAQKTSSNMVIFEYLASSDQWHRLSLFKMRSDHTVTVFKNQYLLLFGGVDAGKLYSDLWLFDLQENKWNALTITGLAPSEGRCLSSLLFEQDFCYIISGCGTHKTIYLDSYRFSTLSLRNSLGMHVEGGGQYDGTMQSLGASGTMDSAAAETVKQELLAVISGLKSKISTLQTDMESIVLENKQLKSRVFELESHVKTLEGSLSDSQTRTIKVMQGYTKEPEDMRAGHGEDVNSLNNKDNDNLHPRDLEVEPAHAREAPPEIQEYDQSVKDDRGALPMTKDIVMEDERDDRPISSHSHGPIEEPVPEMKSMPQMEEIEIEGNSPQRDLLTRVRATDESDNNNNNAEPVEEVVEPEQPVAEEEHKSMALEELEEEEHQPAPPDEPIEEEHQPMTLEEPIEEEHQPMTLEEPIEEEHQPMTLEEPMEEEHQPMTLEEPIEEEHQPTVLDQPIEEEQEPEEEPEEDCGCEDIVDKENAHGKEPEEEQPEEVEPEHPEVPDEPLEDSPLGEHTDDEVPTEEALEVPEEEQQLGEEEPQDTPEENVHEEPDNNGADIPVTSDGIENLPEDQDQSDDGPLDDGPLEDDAPLEDEQLEDEALEDELNSSL